MSVRSLPVILPSIPGQRWSCHSCGHCCRTLVEHVTNEERRRILDQGWAKDLGVEPVVRIGRSWVLNKRDNGACVFLDEENRCRIHSRFGADSKPLACRIFPFSVRSSAKGRQASLRFDCPSVATSDGQPLATHRGWLEQLVTELPHDAPEDHEMLWFMRKRRADPREVREFVDRLRRWLDNDKVSMIGRLLGAARVTGMLAGAKLDRVRDDRFVDLLDLLFETLPGGIATAPDAPTAKQRGMLRQIAFSHAEHVTLAELRSGFLGRWSARWRQLRSAHRFLVGRGDVPPIPGFDRRTTFAAAESVAASEECIGEIEDLLRRYLAARIEGDTVFAGGYYNWPVFDGFAALWLSIAAAGWLARLFAAIEGRMTVSFADAATALGVVDRAATRLPAIGAWSEKARVAFLLRDDGVARLLEAYSPMGNPQEMRGVSSASNRRK